MIETKCDICGRTESQILARGEMCKIYHFKRKNVFNFMDTNYYDFDICDRCMEEIRNRILESDTDG